MLEVKNVTKMFGDFTAVSNVSFTVPKGTILGLIGQNGAGKTTTFRLILNFLTKNQGEILIDGHPLTEKDYNIIGYLPEERGLYPKITIQDQLLYFARLRGKTKAEILPKIDEWMEKFQVKGKKTDKVKTLSKGNQQKVRLIATLIHEPKLIILDEPFSGLDPVNAALLTQGIMELKQKGSAIIFSSHNMDNVEKLCDHLVMLNNGEMVLNGEVHQIRESFGRTKLFLEAPLSKEELEEVPGVKKVDLKKDGIKEILLENAEVGQVIFEKATAAGYIPMFNQQPPTLEEIFKMKVGAYNE